MIARPKWKLNQTKEEINESLDKAKLLPPKTYKALISQDGENAPVVNRVLVNTLGVTPALTRDDVGVYRLTATGQFPQAQTAMQAQNDGITLAGDTGVFIGLERGSDNFVYIKTGSVGVGGVASGDGYLTYTLISVEVYPAP